MGLRGWPQKDNGRGEETDPDLSLDLPALALCQAAKNSAHAHEFVIK